MADRKNDCRASRVIPVYDASGNQLDEIHLSEKIMPIPTKRGGFAESGVYYKGAGIVYRNHLGCEAKNNRRTGVEREARIIGRTELIYENLILCNTNCVGKFGIFKFCHQPIRLKELKGNINDTIHLIKYVLSDDWNTAWDKNLWNDILFRKLFSVLVSGKMCCHLENDSEWDWVRKVYKERIIGGLQ
ncbi:MAG: hypothetical protein NC124_17285 [Clostridium sp.]|nr:hypothetical protein [Clostridium sp.]